MITKKKCFAFFEKKSGLKVCTALNVSNCDNCKFFKTKEEYALKVLPLEYKKERGD